MAKKLLYAFWFFVLLVVGLVLYWLLIFEGKPATNTPENRAAHGYVDGQVNEIRLGDALLRFPAGVQFEPSTLHKIVKGRADEIWFGVFYPDLGENNSVHNGVQIMLKPVLPEWTENLAEREERFSAEKWQKVVQRDDLGLVEYHSVNYGGGWGYITYLASFPEYKTLIGGKITYVCAGNPGREITHCRFANGGYLQKNKVIVTYYIKGGYMKDWKEIHQKVVSFLDSVIVE